MHRTTSGATVVAALVLGLAASSATYAQEGWGATPDLLSDVVATGGSIHAPKVGVDAAGNAVALWTDRGPTIFGPGTVVRTARFDVTTRLWSRPFTLSGGERNALAADVAVDSAGNAVAVWRTNPITVPFLVNAARYEAATQVWSPVTTVVGPAGNAYVAVGSGGRFAVCWTADLPTTGVSCSRYAPGSGWAAAEPISDTGMVSGVALDAAGNITVLLETRSLVVLDGVAARRFDAGTVTWGAVTPLASGLPATPQSRLAMNAAGDAVAIWLRGPSLEASRSQGGAAWGAVDVVQSYPPTSEPSAPRAVIDAAGAITVGFVHTENQPPSTFYRTIHVTRFNGSAWSVPEPLTPRTSGYAYGPPAMDVDSGGNVHVVWSQSLATPGIRLLASRYAVATAQWTTVTNLSAVDQAAYNPDVAVDAGGNALAVWFQTAGGFSVPQALRWKATPPAPAITGGTPGSGTLSVAFAQPPATDPGLAPSNLEYSVDGGVTWTMRAPASAASPLQISGLTDGVVYPIRLRAVSSAGAGTASPVARARSGASGIAPTLLRLVERSGNRVTLAWVEPAAGLVPDAYVIEGGLAGQSQVLATVPTGGAATQMTLTVPDGAFFVQVTAYQRALRLGTSAPVTIDVNGAAAPLAPSGVLGSTNGSAVALSWRNAWDAAVPTAIRLTVSGTVSGTLDLPLSESFTYPNVPPGTYTFTVSALNGVTASAPSAPLTLTFPGTCSGPPQPPAGLSASTQGGMVYLDWLPPSSGEAVTSYVVSVAGAFSGSFPISARTLAAPVPSGSYTVRVASVGICGTSAPTPPQTVVVP